MANEAEQDLKKVPVTLGAVVGAFLVIAALAALLLWAL